MVWTSRETGQAWHNVPTWCSCCDRVVRMARRSEPNAHLCPACDPLVTWLDHAGRHTDELISS